MKLIEYIKGKLTGVDDDKIIVDVHGIGYEVICASPFMFQSLLDESIVIHTDYHVRKDVQCLYGFKNEDEKYLFTKLISVSGIGPKSGLLIQGSVNVSEFVAAVEREDEKYLMSFPGIGKKTARQIILDLKGKLTNFVSLSEESDAEKTVDESALQTFRETEEALQALGYQQQEIQQIMPQ